MSVFLNILSEFDLAKTTINKEYNKYEDIQYMSLRKVNFIVDFLRISTIVRVNMD